MKQHQAGPVDRVPRERRGDDEDAHIGGPVGSEKKLA
jgi:hypothetical protein